MSIVRFVHVDALRLGSPVCGLSDSPDWLRKTAAAAVRTAVINTLEVAIASRCQFVVIAGRLCEAPHDFDLAIGWMRLQTARLTEHGIRLVIAGHPASDFPALAGLDAILVAPGQRLDVCDSGHGAVDFSVLASQTPARRGSLGIEVASSIATRPLADLAYVAAPSEYSMSHGSIDGTTIAHDRLLRLSAGCPQAIQPAERGAFGCQLVEADLACQQLTARFCATDVIRYSQVLLNCLPGTPVDRVCELLRDRSRSIASAGRCTTVVDWLIDGEICWPAGRRESCTEADLLRELRASLNAGHSGAWPGRIRFSDGCTVEVAADSPLAARELATVLHERRSRAMSSTAGSGNDLLTGLTLLRRVA